MGRKVDRDLFSGPRQSQPKIFCGCILPPTDFQANTKPPLISPYINTSIARARDHKKKILHTIVANIEKMGGSFQVFPPFLAFNLLFRRFGHFHQTNQTFSHTKNIPNESHFTMFKPISPYRKKSGWILRKTVV